jgi:predicted permease
MLALGIGANTAIFGIVNGVLLKPVAPLPTPRAWWPSIRRPETSLMTARISTSPTGMRSPRRSITSRACATAAVTLTGHGEAASIPMAVVTPELFPLLGVAPIAGRVLAPSDDAHGAERTAVISETLWTRSFQRDPAIIGKAALLDGDPIVIVGVMPARFEFPFDAENASHIWMPVVASRVSAQWADQRGVSFLKAIGRLRWARPAGRAVRAVGDRGPDRRGQPAQWDARDCRAPFQDVLVKNYRPALIALLGAVATVLLIACANIANLLLARGTARRREIAIRTALGASRGRIVRQLLLESLALAIAGGAAGTVIALWGVDALVRISPVHPDPRLNTVHIDRGVLLFTLAASMLTGALCGLLPALQLSRSNPGDALKGRRSRQGSGRGAPYSDMRS